MSLLTEQAEARARVAPHSRDAEEAVLGAVLISREAANEVIEIFSSEDVFYFQSHNVIFQSIRELFNQDQAIDVVTVGDLLDKRGDLQRVGGVTYLHGLTQAVPTAASAVDYAKIVKDKFLARRLIERCGEVLAAAFTDEEPIEQLLDRAEKEIFEIADMRIQKSFSSLGVVVNEAFKNLERLKAQKSNVSGLATGYNEFDKMTTGLHPGDLFILAARPSVGKTALALNIASRVAIHGGKRVAFFSLEMSKEALAMRVLSTESRVPLQNLRRGFISDKDWFKLTNDASRMLEKKYGFYIDDSSYVSILDMRAKSRRLASLSKDRKLDLIIVDYLQLIATPKGSESRQLAVSEISRELKRLAKDLSVPVIALSQLSRKIEERAGMRPQLSDLRESGSLEQDADLVAFLHREETADKKPMTGTFPMELIIGKQRNGPTGAVNLVYISDITRFENYISDTRVADLAPTV